MFKGYKRTVQLAFDYNEIKEGVPNVKKQMAILNAEFKKSSAEALASGREIDKLGTRYDYLSNKIKIQEEEVQKYRTQLEKATLAEGENSKAVQNATTSLAIAEAKLGTTKAELAQVTNELEKQKTTLGMTSEQWDNLANKTEKIGKSLTMKITAPVVALGAAAFNLGAQYEQALGKMNVVFEDSAKNIEEWASNSLKNFGLAENTAITMASDFGALFKGMGISLKETEEWSKTLTERTMDLSNFYDTTIEETTTALNAIVTGQTEPLRRFGINMTQATLQEYAYANGIKKKVSEMTEAEKVQLRYNFVIDRTAIAVGTTARESDSATGQINRFKESIKELGLAFSEEILPVITPLIENLTDFITKLSEMDEGTKKFIVTTIGMLAVLGPLAIMLSSVFNIISNLSGGLKIVKGALETVGKVGIKFSEILNNTAFLGFAKWAVVIAGVALALWLLIEAINTLIGRSKEANNAVDKYAEVTQAISANAKDTAIRGYAVGTTYVKRNQLAMIHEGEAIIPANENPYNINSKKSGTLGGGDTFILEVRMDEVDEVSKLVRVFEDFKQAKRAGVINV